MPKNRSPSLDRAVPDAEANVAGEITPPTKNRGKRGSFGFEGGAKVVPPKKDEFKPVEEGDVRSNPKFFEHKNYAIQFHVQGGWTDPNGVVHEEESTQLVIANSTDWKTELKDPESGEEIEFMFAIVTAKNAEGDLKLSKMCDAMRDARVVFHTYDMKSGAPMRITRCGATLGRLKAYANATNFKIGLNAGAVSLAAAQIGLVVNNPEGNPGGWYEPFEHLFAPYDASKESLYRAFGPADRLTVFKRLFMADTAYAGDAKGCGFDVNELDSDAKDNEFCLAVFPLHQAQAKDDLAKKWMALDWPWKLPLVAIKEYFGDEIGFYFGFLGHLTTGLLFLAGFAVIAQVVSLSRMKEYGGAMHAESIFAILASGAFFVILDSWKYYEGQTSVLWEVYGCQSSLPPRPGFHGLVLKNPRTGKLEIDFPSHLRRPRLQAGLLVQFTLTAALILTVTGIFILKHNIGTDASQFMQLLPSILNSLQITFYDNLYKFLATRVTEYENHRTIAEHNSQLFKKLTSFYFLNSYSALFYIAFLKKECYENMSGSTYCGRELSMQVLVVFLITDFFNRFMASVVSPFVGRFLKRRAADNDKSMKAEDMGAIEEQFTYLGKYDASTNLVFDYIELFIQWGYLALFGSAAPIVVLLAFVTNFLETRSDGYKLLYNFRRVIPQRVEGVGEPLHVFKQVVFIAIPVNAGLLVFSYGGCDWVPADQRVWVFVGVCALLYALLTLLDEFYPDLPEASEIQLARMQVVYDRVVKETPDDMDLKVELEDADVGKYAAQVKAAKNAARPVPTQAVGELGSQFDLFAAPGGAPAGAKAKKGSKF